MENAQMPTAEHKTMSALEIARRFIELGNREEAVRACTLVARMDGSTPEERMEAALYLFQAEADYRIPYQCFLDLYKNGHFRDAALGILTEGFYAPNEEELRRRYRKNRNLLKKYPYCFRRDFPAFEDLPVRFFPFDDERYFPFQTQTGEFGEMVQPGEPLVRHWFFRDLDKPIRADDIYSQYELEYLCDNVRKSEYVGMDNHVYLCYEDWETFCAWLQVLDMEQILGEEKPVFLFGEERSEYPLDFAARFGVDYSSFPPRHIGIREIHRLILHAQLSFHNGGDFFNEILDSHPCLIYEPSIYLSEYTHLADVIRKARKLARNLKECREILDMDAAPWLEEDIFRLKNPTDKDYMVATLMWDNVIMNFSPVVNNPRCRIAPPVLIQPHFPNMDLLYSITENGYAAMDIPDLHTLSDSPALKEFKYVKSFLPMRRFTTSYGGLMRFALGNVEEREMKLYPEEEYPGYMQAVLNNERDDVLQHIFHRSFMRTPGERLYRDSVVVRLEDGKLNPKATFTALAEFLDIPYTDSMTYCSLAGVFLEGGMSTDSIYRTYDEFVGDNERIMIEYCLRDAYQFYGYDPQWWDGSPMDTEQLKAVAADFPLKDQWLRKLLRIFVGRQLSRDGERPIPPKWEAELEKLLDACVESTRNQRLEVVPKLTKTLHWVSLDGQFLEMIPMLRPKEDLLENPVYH